MSWLPPISRPSFRASGCGPPPAISIPLGWNGPSSRPPSRTACRSNGSESCREQRGRAVNHRKTDQEPEDDAARLVVPGLRQFRARCGRSLPTVLRPAPVFPAFFWRASGSGTHPGRLLPGLSGAPRTGRAPSPAGHGPTAGADHRVRAVSRALASPPTTAGRVLRSLLSALAGAASGPSGAVASPPGLPVSGHGGELVGSSSAEDSSPSILIDSVLGTLTSDKTKQAYATALADSCPGQRNGASRSRDRWSKPGVRRFSSAACPCLR